MQQTQVPSLGQEDPLEDEMTPVFLPGKSQGQKSLAGYSPWGPKESDTTERVGVHAYFHLGDFPPAVPHWKLFSSRYSHDFHTSFKYLPKCHSSKRLVLTAFFKKGPATLSCLLLVFFFFTALVSIWCHFIQLFVACFFWFPVNLRFLAHLERIQRQARRLRK